MINVQTRKINRSGTGSQKHFPIVQLTFIFFGIIAILLTIFSGYQLFRPYIEEIPLITENTNFIQQETKTSRETHAPARIVIADRIDLPLMPGSYMNNSWTLSETYPLYLTDGAYPGEGGNVIIYGHNKKAIFGSLQDVKPQEVITVILADGISVNYVVDWVRRVNPDDLSYIQPQKIEMLTLYTCSGMFDRERFVVRAYPDVR